MPLLFSASMLSTLNYVGLKRVEASALCLWCLVMKVDAQKVESLLALGRGHDVWRRLHHSRAEFGHQGALGDPQVIDLLVSSLVDYRDEVSVRDANDA